MTTTIESMSDENTTYGLRVMVLGRTPLLPIGETEFLKIKASKALLVDALGSEESFHLLLGNFYEYEATLLQKALYTVLFTEGSWSDFSGLLHEVNRRVVNFLSASRAYLDQGAHLISSRFGKQSEEAAVFKQWRSHEYDSRLGFRVMEELRNYTQHRGLAVHQLSHDHWRRGEGEKSVARNALIPSLSIKRLRDDGGFKTRLLKELEPIADLIDIRPLIREHLAGIANVHNNLRERLKDEIDAADKTFFDAIERYRREGQDSVLGLSAIKHQGTSHVFDEVPIFDDLITRRRDLVLRTQRVPFIPKIYTTNEPRSASE